MKKIKTMEINIHKAANGTFEAKAWFQATYFAGDDGCSTEREALASLALSMGLHKEMDSLRNLAPDYNLHG